MQYEPPRNTQLFKIAHLMGKSHRLQSLDRRLDLDETAAISALDPHARYAAALGQAGCW